MQVAHVEQNTAGRLEATLPTGYAWSGDMLRGEDGALSPHAFYVHQDPHVVLDRHYHDAAEFQVVVAGGGKLGHHDVAPYAVHYASHQAVYGPLVAGEQGLDYITCRAIYQRGLFFWPQERERMSRGLKAQSMGEAAPCDLTTLQAPRVDVVIEADESGLAAWVMRLPANGVAPTPVHPGGAGQFLLMTQGAATVAGQRLKPLSIGWLGGDHAVATAAGEGAELLVLQLPGAAAQDAAALS